MFSAFPPSVGSLRAPKEALRVLLVLRAALCSPWGHTPHTRVFNPGGPTTRVFSSLDEARGPHLALTPPRCFSRPRPHRDRPPPSPPPPPPRSRPMTRAPASFLPARPCLPLCPGGGADPTRCCPVLPGPLPPQVPAVPSASTGGLRGPGPAAPASPAEPCGACLPLPGGREGSAARPCTKRGGQRPLGARQRGATERPRAARGSRRDAAACPPAPSPVPASVTPAAAAGWKRDQSEKRLLRGLCCCLLECSL